MKKVNEVQPKPERAHTIRFESPRAIKSAKPLSERNAKQPVNKKFR